MQSEQPILNEPVQMNILGSSVLEIISNTAAILQHTRLNVCSMLSIDPHSSIGCALRESDEASACRHLVPMLKRICLINQSYHATRCVTDWPFENFWGNPHEPRHSKLIGYFIDPTQGHGCGEFLLRKLLRVLEDSMNQDVPAVHYFPPDNCQVFPESEHIDLCIERKLNDRRFAIIIENKVNSARDQNNQLQRYVEHVKEHHGFAYGEIYVFYLPLTADKKPASADRERVESQAHYKHITFANHILQWLNSALQDWPRDNEEGMRENLMHYRSLIRYLNRKHKEVEMHARILEQLEQAETKNALPTLADLDGVKQSLDELRKCLQQVVRGKLLLAIMDILRAQQLNVWLCLEKDPFQQADIRTPFDSALGASTNVCLRVTGGVHVCFGGNQEHKFWLGYLRDGCSQQERLESVVLQEAEKQLTNIKSGDSTWYAWAWRDGVYDESDCENSAAAIASRLTAMRKSLLDRLEPVEPKV